MYCLFVKHSILNFHVLPCQEPILMQEAVLLFESICERWLLICQHRYVTGKLLAENPEIKTLATAVPPFLEMSESKGYRARFYSSLIRILLIMKDPEYVFHSLLETFSLKLNDFQISVQKVLYFCNTLDNLDIYRSQGYINWVPEPCFFQILSELVHSTF